MAAHWDQGKNSYKRKDGIQGRNRQKRKKEKSERHQSKKDTESQHKKNKKTKGDGLKAGRRARQNRGPDDLNKGGERGDGRHAVGEDRLLRQIRGGFRGVRLASGDNRGGISPKRGD